MRSDLIDEGSAEIRLDPVTPVRVPSSTYRIQVTRDFGFTRLGSLCDYLDALAVSDVYTSPLLAARPGSSHGYDVTDPTRLSSELGRPEEFVLLAAELRRRKMGILMDFVPNHMCVAGNENPWWRDVLRNGTASKHARWFDVYWDPAGRVHVPLLGAELDEVIERGELLLGTDPDGFCLKYYDQSFPLSDAAANLLAERLLAVAPDAILRDSEGMHDALAKVATPAILRELLDVMPCRPEHWRSALYRPGYRRFFNINELVGLRVEEPLAFAAVHEKALGLLAAGQITGLRIDHVDGLLLPRRYLSDLARACRAATGATAYVIIEKILSSEEELPRGFRASGTSGYEFLNELGGLFVHPEGARAVRSSYARFTGDTSDFEDVAYDCKHHELSTSLEGDAARLTSFARRLLPPEPPAWERDLKPALVALMCALTCYRTYWEPGDELFSPDDAKRVEAAFATASRRNPRLSRGAFDFLRLVLLDPWEAANVDRAEFVLRFQQLTGPAAAKGVEDTAFYRHVPLLCANEVGGNPGQPFVSIERFHTFAQRRQRYWPHALSTTSTHDTKRGEDARLRIAALSEIPDEWAEAVERWRRHNREHLGNGGHAPDALEEYFLYQTLVGALPDAGPHGAPWSDFVERVCDYVEKALREAKRTSDWLEPNVAHEKAVRKFVRTILDGGASTAFLDDLRAFCEPVHRAAALSSVAQTVVKVACPGVPDFYQGSELWDLSMVDPDNRRPVDFEHRRRLLFEVKTELARRPLETWTRLWDRRKDGAFKLAVVHRALSVRRRSAELFRDGAYVPLEVSGPRADHVVAFGRTLSGAAAVVVCGRWFLRLSRNCSPRMAGSFRDTFVHTAALPRGRYEDAFTRAVFALGVEGFEAEGERLPLASVFRDLPVALLERTA